MLKQYIMTVMAANRVGILAALATALDELGGGFVDISQAVMRRYFTIIMAVEFPANRDPAVIKEHIEDVCRPFGIEVLLKDPQTELESETIVWPPRIQQYLLRLSGRDTKGVMRRVAYRLAQDGIDVVDLYGARDDEQQTFSSCLHLDVPDGVNIPRLFRDLDQMLRPEGVTIGLHHDRVLQAISRPQLDTLVVNGS